MKHLFFDLDGTLVDSSKGILNCFTKTFTELKVEVPPLEVLKTFIGPPLEVSFANFLEKDQVNQAVTIYRQHYQDFGIHQVSLYDGFPQALDCLIDKGVKLYIATSKHEPMAIQMLTDLGINDKFTGIFGSLGNDSKADVIQRGLDTYRISIDEAVMIGDTLYDMVGGKSLGLKTIGVTWGFGSKDSLLENGADDIINDPSELIDKVSE